MTARGGQNLVVGVEKEGGIVADDILIKEIAHIQEEEGLMFTNGVEHSSIRTRRRAGAQGDGVAERPLAKGPKTATGSRIDSAVEFQIVGVVRVR